MEPLVLVIAVAIGLLIRQIGYPPLPGYLVAGFIASWLHLGTGAALTPVVEAGIILLLFLIGLKLNFRALTPRYVWGTALAHMLIAVPLTTAVILTVGLVYAPMAFEHAGSAWTLAFALSFSSTVFAVKTFEDRGESASFYASIAIGILVIQDIMAVIYLVLSSGVYPSLWAVLLFALPLLRRPVRYMLLKAGHGELLLLCGVTIAFGVAQLFETLQLKAGLGALAAGMLIAATQHDKAKELYKRLYDLKDLLLVAFILQVGYYGIPSIPMVFVAFVLAILILLRPVIYFTLLVKFGLRARTSTLVGASLFNYSEFGLIVAAAAAEVGVLNAEWVTTLALAMALSFVLATPVNHMVHPWFRRFQSQLTALENTHHLPEEAIGSLGDADTVVLGMGRVGRGAYAALLDEGQINLAGVDESYLRMQQLNDEGYRCVHGDASDRDFWERTGLADRRLLLLSLSNHNEHLAVVKLALELGFCNTLAVATKHTDEKEELEALGCLTFNLYQDVGREFARHSLSLHDEKHT